MAFSLDGSRRNNWSGRGDLNARPMPKHFTPNHRGLQIVERQKETWAATCHAIPSRIRDEESQGGSACRLVSATHYPPLVARNLHIAGDDSAPAIRLAVQKRCSRRMNQADQSPQRTSGRRGESASSATEADAEITWHKATSQGRSGQLPTAYSHWGGRRQISLPPVSSRPSAAPLDSVQIAFMILPSSLRGGRDYGERQSRVEVNVSSRLQSIHKHFPIESAKASIQDLLDHGICSFVIGLPARRLKIFRRRSRWAPTLARGSADASVPPLTIVPGSLGLRRAMLPVYSRPCGWGTLPRVWSGTGGGRGRRRYGGGHRIVVTGAGPHTRTASVCNCRLLSPSVRLRLSRSIDGCERPTDPQIAHPGRSF